MGTRRRHLLYIYWYQLAMVEHAGGYYDTDFNGYWSTTQEDPLLLTIFNVVVDAVVRHWVSMVVDRK